MDSGLGSQSLWRRQVTRRDVLRGTGAIGTAVLAGSIFGCGGSAKQQETAVAGPSPTPTGPRRGGTLIGALNSQMADLNPQRTASAGAATYYFIYDHLFYYDWNSGKYDLGVAQSIESPDPLTYIFKLKPNAKFQNLPPVNGRPVTSEDIVVSWKRFVDDPRTGNKGFFTDSVDHYETPEPATLVVKMKTPNTWAIGPHGLGAPLPTVIVPKELFENDQLNKVAVGSGAYVLENFDPGSVISFVRRPDSWHTPDRPYIDKRVFQVITDAPARAAALKGKQIDSLLARDKLQADEFKGYGPDMRIQRELFLPFSLLMRADAPDGLFHDVRVREAVYKALDIQDLIDRVELGEGEWEGPVPKSLNAWALPDAELKKAFPHDVAKAKELLAAAGWDSSREVELKYPNSEKDSLICQILQKQLEAAGIRTKLVPQDRATVWSPQTLTGKNFQLTAAYYTASRDPDFWLRYHSTQGAGLGNLCRWSDPEVDAIIVRQQREFDFEKQRQIILEAQRMLLAKFAPTINLYSPYNYTACWEYYHPTGSSFLGIMGQYDWIDTSSPSYPQDRR